MKESIKESLRKQFDPYIKSAIEECQAHSFQQKTITMGSWNNDRIIDYLSRLEADMPVERFSNFLKEIFPDQSKKMILCVGGGVGRVGRHIARTNRNTTVYEIDTSMEMVAQANNLAAQEGINQKFKSTPGNVLSIPFPDNEFDYAIAYGLFRYLDPLKDQKRAVNEMLRVSKYGITISEGKAEEIIYSLRDAIDPKLKIEETKLPMFRMSLFYILSKQYERGGEFKALVDDTGKNDPIKLLTCLAGSSIGTLCELKLRKKQESTSHNEVMQANANKA